MWLLVLSTRESAIRGPVFRDYAGRSRIAAIWNIVTIQTGTPPEGFAYGTEYTKAMIDEALASENPLSIVPSTDGNGHGSVMASLAAGSSIEEGSFVGAAPDSQIVVVKPSARRNNISKTITKFRPAFPAIANQISCRQSSICRNMS